MLLERDRTRGTAKCPTSELESRVGIQRLCQPLTACATLFAFLTCDFVLEQIGRILESILSSHLYPMSMAALAVLVFASAVEVLKADA